MKILYSRSLIVQSLILILVQSVLFSACADPETDNVKQVDRSRFLGTWYEVGVLPNSFNKGCSCNKIDLQEDPDDGYVKMIYSCIKKEKQGAVLAKIFYKDANNFSSFKLQYFWPFRNKLFVMALDSGYTYSMIAGPDRDHLQILSRNKTLDEATVRMLVNQAGSQGYDVDALVFPEQTCP